MLSTHNVRGKAARRNALGLPDTMDGVQQGLARLLRAKDGRSERVSGSLLVQARPPGTGG
jgi:hypothetical protein